MEIIKFLLIIIFGTVIGCILSVSDFTLPCEKKNYTNITTREEPYPDIAIDLFSTNKHKINY